MESWRHAVLVRALSLTQLCITCLQLRSSVLAAPTAAYLSSFTAFWRRLFTLRYPFWESGDIPAVARLEDMAAAAQHEPIRYDVRPFAIMSPQGLEFMQRLLCRDEQERMGVHEALTHPWLAAAIANLTSKEGAHEVPCSNLDEK